MNMEDLIRDIDEYYMIGDREYADDLETLRRKIEELDDETDTIEEWRVECAKLQDDVNDKWDNYPKINIF